MSSILKEVLEEELQRNLQKQRVFKNEFDKYPRGSLVISKIHGDKYVYRKYREGDKIVSEYIGPFDSDAVKQAFDDRNKHLKYKQSLKNLKNEEIKLKKTIKIL